MAPHGKRGLSRACIHHHPAGPAPHQKEPPAHPARGRREADHRPEATDDILVRAGVLADDCAAVVAGHDGSRVLLDRQRPRVEIEITGMEEIKP